MSADLFSEQVIPLRDYPNCHLHITLSESPRIC